MKKVLFVCTFYGARSLLAERIASSRNYPDIQVFSACFEEGRIGLRIYNLLREINIVFDAAAPKLVWDRYNDNEKFDVVVTLCNGMGSEQCPVFNANIDSLYGSVAKIYRWSIPDFMAIEGDDAEWLLQARQVRDMIEYKVDVLLRELSDE